MKQSVKVVVKTVLISFLRIYKLAISPLLPPSCRFIPTCSEYAIERDLAIRRLARLAVGYVQITKVSSFHPGGYDPVK